MRPARLLAFVLVLTACGAPPTIVKAGDPVIRPTKALTETATTTSSPPVTYHAAAVEPAPPPPERPPAVTTGATLYGWPCGNDLPPCSVARREGARGNPAAVNTAGASGRTCGGLWQFDPVTWSPSCSVSRWNGNGPPCATYRGFRFAQDAPGNVQNDRAREIWAGGRGCNHWAACTR